MMQAFGRLTLGMALAAGVAWAAPALAQDKTILFSISKASEPFFEVMREHAEDEAGKLGVRLIFEDGKGDSVDQTADIENAIARERIDAALIAPNDIYALAPEVNFAQAHGIPVITVDRHVYNTVKEVPHVGIDNVAGGRLLAQWVVDNFPRGAKIHIIPHKFG